MATTAALLPKLKPTPQTLLHSFTTLQPLSILQLPTQVFSSPIRPDLINRAVQFEMNSRRAGTHSTKTLSEISGSGRKPAPQKGRGKARIGTLRAPQCVGGYKPHGPKPRDHSTDLPRKVYSFALRSLLTSKFNQGQVLFFDSLTPNFTSSEEFLQKLTEMKEQFGLDVVTMHQREIRPYSAQYEEYKCPRKLCLVTSGDEPPVKLMHATSKLDDVVVVNANEIGMMEIINREWVFCEQGVGEILKERFCI